jgi:hypothetical protein
VGFVVFGSGGGPAGASGGDELHVGILLRDLT